MAKAQIRIEKAKIIARFTLGLSTEFQSKTTASGFVRLAIPHC
jgi:hypothetical protein